MAKQKFQHRNRRGRPRRGVLLLVVMSMLVLFVLLGVTFTILSTQYKSSAESFRNRQDRAAVPPHELSEAAQQVLRGTLNRQSVLQGHCLLEDLYGSDGVQGIASSVFTGEVGGQYLRFNFTPNAVASFATVNAFYNGAVLTMIDGPAKGHSTRVVAYQPALTAGATTGGILRVEMFASDLGATVLPVVGDSFLINGRAFNGLGFGFRFSGAGSNLNAMSPAIATPAPPVAPQPVALQPNFSGYSTTVAVNVAGADESWDAPDYQNMLLGLIQRTDTGTVNVLPSLHRPALVNYWMNHNGGTTWSNLAFRRRVVMRPLPSDHPNFSGSNPTFHPVSGPWDVDNDGDAIPDSVWVDLGAPIKTGPDGRRYKPLFAILCQDLDGRINLNAHGNGAQLLGAYSANVPTANTTTEFPNPTIFAGGSASLSGRYRGHGYGPADIATHYAFLNSTEHSAFLLARYAGDGSLLPGLSSIDDPFSRIRNPDLPADYAMIRAGYGTPPDSWGRGSIAIDPAGRPVTYFMGLSDETLDDPYEIDLSHKGSHAAGADAPFTAAELEVLLRFHDSDAGTLPSRMTAMARTTFVGPGGASAALQSDRRRGIVTTESRHIPVPMVASPKDLRGSAELVQGRALHIIDMVRAKLLQANPTADVNFELAKMLPVEMLAGGKMDLNRMWGNGVDDDGDLLVDEPGEAAVGEMAWTGLGLPNGYASVPMVHINDDPLITNPAGARQIFARHLYCLMMFLIDLESDSTGTLSGYLHPTSVALPAPDLQELTARRIAQWAINVVDFRDPDSIMTPFEYDANPYNGWITDGNLQTDELGDRRLVWGCEYPDLVLTEIVAFHDRRVKDTEQDDHSETMEESDPYPQKRKHSAYDPALELDDPDQKKGDSDLDQFRIPQGSLFLEFYCTRNRQVNNPNFPTDLYSLDTGDGKWKLDLGRLSPANDGGLRYPVWRTVITKHPDSGTGQASVAQQAIARPDKITYQPKIDPSGSAADNPAGTNVIPTEPDEIEIERVVWFTNSPATTHAESAVTYYNRNAGDVLIEPGAYAVAGPRQKTVIGRKSATSVEGTPSSQVIDLSNGTVRVTDGTGATIYPLTAAKTPVSIICGAAPPTVADPRGAGFSWPATASIGLNCTEPLPQSGHYYDRPTHHPVPLDVTDGYYADPATGVNAIDATGYPDVPFDSEQGEVNPDDEPPLFRDEVLATGSYPDYKTALLQRLADPTAPWDRQYNPYITIDWSIIDLTVYNGEDQEPATFPAALGEWDPAEETPGPNRTNVRFATRERGRVQAGTLVPLRANLWEQNSVEQTVDSIAVGATEYFPYNLGHTLGYLNFALGTPRAAPAGNLGDPDDTAMDDQPFPWLTWNNRPYSSHLELMLVPASSPQRLLHEFTLHSISEHPYNPTAADTNEQFHAPYGHLLNFFQTHENDDSAAHFYRLFDYVEVPSRFVRTHKHYSPSEFGNSVNVAAIGFRPPFNHRSRFRDPGRMNINTIADPLVWQALMHGFPSMATNAFWFDFVKSRRGYATGNSLFEFNNSYPTLFANPFRAAAAADLAPLPALRTKGVEATLLRSADPATPTESLFGYESTEKFDNTSRNPFFHYHSIQRLGNLVSTTSNVYAVWITVGYFEVEAAYPLPSEFEPPDGFLLGQELGSDTGEIQRHRMFMMVDRSIPVAFQPGQDHNVDRAVLLRRFIE
jgi:hypothetical protein